LVEPDASQSLNAGALQPWNVAGTNFFEQLVTAIAERFEVNLDTPWGELTDAERALYMEGTDGERIMVSYKNRYGRKRAYSVAWEGLLSSLKRRYDETDSQLQKDRIEEWMALRACPECDGEGCEECYGDEDRDRAHDHAQGMERESAGMAESAADVKYGVFAKGGSVGSQRFRDDPLKTFDTREEAVADARRRRSGLSKGERGYYRMGYVVKPVKGEVDEGWKQIAGAGALAAATALGGYAAGSNKNDRSQMGERNMYQNTNKEIVAQGQYPTLSGPKLIPTKEYYLSMEQRDKPNFSRSNPPTIKTKINLEDREMFRTLNVKNKVEYDERLYDELLSQLNDNPIVNNINSEIKGQMIPKVNSINKSI
jgi:hypothetical protein